MHDGKAVSLAILRTDAFSRPTNDGIDYVSMCNSMAYGHAVGVLVPSVHLSGEKFLNQANFTT